jgi:hypothetical protein
MGRPALKYYPALVLNADFPASFYPLSLWPWREAVKAAWLDRVDIVSEYEGWCAAIDRIPSGGSQDYVRPQNGSHSPVSTCFCAMNSVASIGRGQGVTVDHVVPRALAVLQAGNICRSVFADAICARVAVIVIWHEPVKTALPAGARSTAQCWAQFPLIICTVGSISLYWDAELDA